MSLSRIPRVSSSLLRRIISCQHYDACVFFSTQDSLKEKQTVKPFSEIPGPPKIPFLKATWIFLPLIGPYNFSSMETSYVKFYKKYGPLVRLETIDEPLVFVFDRDLIRQVYQEEGEYPNRPGFGPLRKYKESRPEAYSNKGLLVTQGEEWKKLRELTRGPMLTLASVRLYVPAMETVTIDFIERLRELRSEDMEVKNILPQLFRWSLESVGIFALHKRLGCLDRNLTKDSPPQRLIDAVSETFRCLYKLDFKIGIERLNPKKTYQRFEKAQNYFTAITYKYLTEAIEEIRLRGPRKEGEQTYLLDSFLYERNMNLSQVSGIVFDLFFAGIETTSSTIAFLLQYLACNKDKQEKLYEEISRVFSSKDEPITGNKLDHLPYLHACIKETLRLHAITVGTGRLLDHDIVLGGYHIPKNTILALITSLTSRLEKYYEMPLDFLPERWLEGDTPEEKRMRESVGLPGKYIRPGFASVPFSHGSRMCIGRRFAEQEMDIIIIKMIQNFTLSCRQQLPMSTRQGVVNIPNRPIDIIFRDRKLG